MHLPDPDLIFRTTRVVGATIGSGLGYIWAQIQWPGLEGFGSLGILGALAILVGRYTFRQLEDYRSDLKDARTRIDDLEEDLHELGKAKAQTERRNRELEAYTHRLQLWVTSQGLELPADIPPPRPTTS